MKKKEKIVTKKRCAIYTRKSTNNGLEQDYNSLDAQYDSCVAYINSQKQEGWMLVPDRYEDAAISGGTLERPALQQLLKDIERNLIDIIVIYKVDRLTRSLLDFSKLVDIFDRHNVSFISITQSFNSTTSMGRLTLNMLLSFSQYEREIAAERIKDKFAASKRRGLWVGGVPPLGYDVEDRKLIINPDEAKRIQFLFQHFIKTGSTTSVVKAMAEKGYQTKSWTTQSGKMRQGKAFEKSAIYRVLHNKLYIGKIAFKGEVYPGQHDAIINNDLWNQAQRILDQNNLQKKRRQKAASVATLRSLVKCGHCNRMMTPRHTRKKNGRAYHYYTCTKTIKYSYDTCPIGSIPAGEIEKAVFNQVKQIIASPEIIVRTWKRVNAGSDLEYSEWEVSEALQSLAPIWEELFPGERRDLVQLLIGEIEIRLDGLKIQIPRTGLNSLVRELSNG
ncbi:recombinase family protein [Magnetococcales bacterium HHB-1]